MIHWNNKNVFLNSILDVICKLKSFRNSMLRNKDLFHLFIINTAFEEGKAIQGHTKNPNPTPVRREAEGEEKRAALAAQSP